MVVAFISYSDIKDGLSQWGSPESLQLLPWWFNFCGMVSTGPDSEVDMLLTVSQVVSWLKDVLSLWTRGGLLKLLCQRT